MKLPRILPPPDTPHWYRDSHGSPQNSCMKFLIFQQILKMKTSNISKPKYSIIIPAVRFIHMKRDGLVSPGFRSSLIQSKTETADTSLKGEGGWGLQFGDWSCRNPTPCRGKPPAVCITATNFPKITQ